jgi:hypothetical protein
MPTLAYCDVDGVDRACELGPAPVVVGRSPECTIRSDDARVSRHHARFWFDGAYVWVEDLASANGVWVGPQRITRSPVPIGELVVAGSLLLRLDPHLPPQAQPGLHTQLSEWLRMERKAKQGVEAERDAFAQRVGELHGEVGRARAEGQAGGQAETMAARAEAAAARTEAQAAQAALAAARTEAQATQFALAAARAEGQGAQAVHAALAAARGETQATQAALTAARGEAQAAQAALAAARGEAQTARGEAQAAQAALAAARAETQAARAEAAELQTSLNRAEREVSEARFAPPPAPPAPVPTAAASIPPEMNEHLATLGDSISSLRASMRAVSDETAIMEQSDSLQVVTAAVASATEDIERARDALRALSAIAGT